MNHNTATTIAYLGPAGTFSETAAQQLFGKHGNYVPCDSFEIVIAQVEAGKASAGVLPIENSSEGTVYRVLDLLADTSLKIQSEVLLPIHHQLLSMADNLEDITEVLAHPQALDQCRQWLTAHLPQASRREASSNAAAAQYAARHTHIAAIAGAAAAKRYNLPIMAAGINDNPNNTTRFIAVGKTTAVAPAGYDKTSVVCTIPHQPGSLHTLLGIFAKHGINLAKLESRPAESHAWEYLFYIDFEGHAQDPPVAAALAETERYSVSYKLLGSYPRAKEIKNNASK